VGYRGHQKGPKRVKTMEKGGKNSQKKKTGGGLGGRWENQQGTKGFVPVTGKQ